MAKNRNNQEKNRNQNSKNQQSQGQSVEFSEEFCSKSDLRQSKDCQSSSKK